LFLSLRISQLGDKRPIADLGVNPLPPVPAAKLSPERLSAASSDRWQAMKKRCKQAVALGRRLKGMVLRMLLKHFSVIFQYH